MHWYTDVLRRYADFDGRSDRPEFWWFGLINVVVSLVIWGICVAAFGLATGQLVAILYGPVTLLAVLGVEILATAGTQGPNGYGPQPPPRVAA